ncbi:MAG TPA: family 20 glycosylhydrolase [Dyella sp.]|uniref:family 20 glycosylhydrolase n=1 Tax=Dyella sp. TaxID=1869338 RepID=UPI002F9590B7
MKTLRHLLSLALIGCATNAMAVPAQAPLPLIPLPAKAVRAQGTLVIDANTPVIADDEGGKQAANYLLAQLERAHGLHLTLHGGTAAVPAIVFERDPHAVVAHPEGYVLDITPHGVRIAARSDAGLFYGAVTLWQLLTAKPGLDKVSLAAVHIEDQPRFAWRGLMLDSARHFQSIEDVRAVIDQLALHKLNVLHWHLTDDQGWRIEIKRYPELTRIGAWRTPPGAGEDGEPKQYGGFYTQDEIRQTVAYAAARHVTIVPELDMPGHAQAAVAAYPELGVTGKRPPVSVDWGVNPYLYNVDDHTIVFLEHVLDEVMDLFPSQYIHLGGDEAIKDQWQASPAIQAKMKALGIGSEDALQSWMIEHFGKYLAAHGRRLIGWDEILEGGVPPSATVMSWRGTKGAVAAARQGHDVVLSPAPDLYFDGLQSTRDDEYTGRMPAMDLAHIYGFEAVPAELSASQARHVLGVQANVWTEHLPTMRHIQHAVYPRLDALAEAAWTPKAARRWDSFVARLPAQLERYRGTGIEAADSAFAPAFVLDRNAAIAHDKATVTLSNQARAGVLRYTLDGSEPTAASTRYGRPFVVNLPATLRAATFAADGTVLAAPRSFALDQVNLRARNSGELENCPGSDFTLRVQPMPDASSVTPVYNINVFDACRLYRAASLDGVHAIEIDAARLPRNYALAHEAKLVKSYPASTAHGELVVRQDRCDGPLLATLPLPAPEGARQFRLQGVLTPATGVHDLCLIFTSPIDGPLYGIGKAALRTGHE